VVANLEPRSPELLMHPWCAVEASVPLKHLLHLGGDGCVLLGPWARIALTLPPRVEATAGHTDLHTEPSHRKKI
jgi:hypothetical protein